MARAAGALSGVRVLDLTAARAGPTCTRQLTHLGADVIQVWQPDKSDLTGSDFANLHHGKKSIVVDLRSADGVAVLKTLAKQADVLVENYRPGVKRRLGIGPRAMLEVNPRLIYASISGFGQDGPYAERPGVDPIAQGYAGLMSVTGPAGQGPWRVGIAIADTASGMFLTQGVLAALYARERTGRGQWVHTSLIESLVNMMDFQAVRWLVDHVVPQQMGNEHPTIFPFGTFRTADGLINLGSTDFAKFCRQLGLDTLAADPRFADGKGRNANRAALVEIVEGVLQSRTTADLVAAMGDVIPCGPVLTMDKVFEDVQVKHLALTARVGDPKLGSIEVLRYPVNFSDTPAQVTGPVVTLGGDTRTVLRDAGYGEAEIEALIASGAVATQSRGKGW